MTLSLDFCAVLVNRLLLESGVSGKVQSHLCFCYPRQVLPCDFVFSLLKIFFPFPPCLIFPLFLHLG